MLRAVLAEAEQAYFCKGVMGTGWWIVSAKGWELTIYSNHLNDKRFKLELRRAGMRAERDSFQRSEFRRIWVWRKTTSLSKEDDADAS